MYQKVHEFYDRFYKVGSSATEPTNKLTNTQYYGDKTQEIYGASIVSLKSREELRKLLGEVIERRKLCGDGEEKVRLFRLERKIESTLRGMKQTTIKKRTFSQCFMNCAEQMISPEVMKNIVQKTHELYHGISNGGEK